MIAHLMKNRMVRTLSLWPKCLMALAIIGVTILDAAPSAKTGGPTRTLNQTTIHQAYRDGEFERVTQTLQSFISQNPILSSKDSVFVAKHLAVIYAANPQTREKGKYYMYRMLESDPHADLVDMFVSDDVDAAFEKVRKEFKSQHPAAYQRPSGRALTDNDAGTTRISTSTKDDKAPIAMPAKSEIGQSKKSNAVWWWVAGGAVAVGAGIATAVVIQGNEAEPGETHKVQLK
jgi:hypothetical protein